MRDTHTSCRAFGSEAATTGCNDLGLSRLGFEHPIFCLRGERSNPLRHRRGLLWYMKLLATLHKMIILPLIEILKFDWMRQILYAAILCFLTNIIFLIYPLHVTYWPHITFLNPITWLYAEFYILTSHSSKQLIQDMFKIMLMSFSIYW